MITSEIQIERNNKKELTKCQAIIFESMISDQNNRDNITSYDGNIFLLAGAGTGKSTSIARKIIYLLESKKILSIKEVTAITYTKKSATELRWKIEKELLKKHNEENNSPVFQKALVELNDAVIGTIHSFCSLILRKVAITEGLNPSFKICDEDESSLMLKNAIEEYISVEWLADCSKILPLWKQIIKYEAGFNFATIANNLQTLHQKYSLIKEISEETFLIKKEEDLLKRTDTLFQKHKTKLMYLFKFYDYSQGASQNDPFSLYILKLISALEQCNNFTDAKLILSEIETNSRGSKKLVNDSLMGDSIMLWLKHYAQFLATNDITCFKKLDTEIDPGALKLFCLDDYPDTFPVSSSILTAEYLRYLWFNAIKEFELFYDDYKKKNSLVDYDDLVKLTHKLSENEKIKKFIQKQMKYLFVDEYQDTDPVQTALFNNLSEIYKIKDNNPVKLFRVGDPKQSIYLFRGADVDTFNSEKEKFRETASGLTENLFVNMRSKPAIVNFINSVFNDSHSTTLSISNYEPIEPKPDHTHAGEVSLSLLNLRTEDDADETGNINTNQMRSLEANWLARTIASGADDYTKSSIAILVQTMSDIDIYCAALEQYNIPYKLYGRTYYGENLVIRYLFHLIKFIIDPTDTISLMGLLRSPLAGFSDSEIEELYLHSESFDNILNIDEKSFLSAEIIQKTNKLKERCKKAQQYFDMGSLTLMISELYSSMPFYQINRYLLNPEAGEESLDKCIEWATSLDKNSSASIKEKAMRLIEKLSEMENVSRESSSEEGRPQETGVQIMTYHKSKGLEFDTVYLPNLYMKPNNKSENITIESEYCADEHPDHRFKIHFDYQKAFPARRADQRTPQKIQKEKSSMEKVRLLYVAMTRARSKLVISVPHPEFKKDKNTLAAKLTETIAVLFSVNYNEIEPDKKYTFDLNKFDRNKINSFELKSSFSIELQNPAYSEPPGKIKTENAAPSVVKKTFTNPSPYYFYSGTSLLKKIKKKIETTTSTGTDETDDDTRGEIIEAPKGKLFFVKPGIESKESIHMILDPVTRGVITHTLFEWMDLKNPSWHKDQTTLLLKTHHLQTDHFNTLHEYLQETMDTYKKSPLHQMIQICEITGKEVPFSMMSEQNDHSQAIAVGYIDLVLTNKENEILLVDYKTNRQGNITSSEFEKKILADYEIPMKIYLEAAQGHYKGQKTTAALYLTASGELLHYKNHLEKIIIPQI